jgi:predicted ribosome quality control (RQC) complex YloA/Tae2 family protein
MTLDSWMVERLARELHAALAEARVQDVRSGPQHLSIACYRRRTEIVLRASIEPNAPVVALLEREQIESENGAGGWAGGVAPLLRGSIVTSVHAVPNDRILNVDTISRSAFGVPAMHRVTIELEPRKANALVLRPLEGGAWSVLATAKQFSGDDGGRAIAVGELYEAPPPRRQRLDRTQFEAAVVAASEPIETRALAKLLGDFDPTCTPPLARDIVERALAEGVPREELSRRLLELWDELRPVVAARSSDLTAPIIAYRRGLEIVACHVVPLSWATGERTQVASLAELSAERIVQGAKERGIPAAIALRKRLTVMLQRRDAEVASLLAARQRAAEADALRLAGDAIYANLAAIEPRARELVAIDGLRVALDPLLTAKANAAQYFKRYKKARSGLPQIEARLRALAQNKAFWDQLVWELDRAETMGARDAATVYEEVGKAIGARRRVSARVSKQKPARRPERAVDLGDGAVAYVGRSPVENDRLTFSVARPDDLWFHARNMPGAHVILKMPRARAKPTEAQIVAAAALAAGQSRGSDAGKVEVDYTQRKHVRRQSVGKPGLVWYTDFKTVLVTPADDAKERR